MDLSIVVCAYDMGRELPRTIQTLSRAYQRNLPDIDYEIVVVDNGSPIPVDEAELRRIMPDLRVVRVEAALRSPARAINAAMGDLNAQMLGLWVDGARMASPGMIALAVDACRGDATKIVGSLSFHLGPDVQMRSLKAGYDRGVEDTMLDATPWREDGYRLFDVSVLANSSAEGWFGPIAESNGVFFSGSFWNVLGGLDERFEAPGGGYVNLDFWERAVALSDRQPVMLLGEGTFHQVHGETRLAAAKTGQPGTHAMMRAEYSEIHGRDHALPTYFPRFVGSPDSRRLEKGLKRFAAPGRQAHSIGARPFEVAIPPALLDSVQVATLKTRYRGRRLCKNPFDLAIYLMLLQELEPRTIIEIGTLEGGSALWLRDQCRALGLARTEVLGIDLQPPDLAAEGVRFVPGDSLNPGTSFPTELIDAAPHPWLVIEDSAHSYAAVSAVLDYFHERLQPGDYLVVEDGVVADMGPNIYRRYEDGPNRAVAELLTTRPEHYVIDTALCDYYGRNVTYCPNAWLKRVG